MMLERPRGRCISRLTMLATSEVDIDTLRLETMEELRDAIGFERWGFPLIDPVSLIPNRPLVSDLQPWGSRLPERWVLDQSVGEINSRASLARSPNRVGVLSVATGGDLSRCHRWREFGQPIGMGDELRAVIVDEYGCWGSFELFRGSDDPPFDDDDARLMREAAQVLARPLRRAHVNRLDCGDAGPDQIGTVIIDDHLHVGGFTQAAHAWFPLLGAREMRERTPLPIYVYGVVGRLLAVEAGEDTNRPPRVRVRTTDGRWAVVEAARIDGTGNGIAVTIRPAGADDILSIASRAAGLTARERELAALVMEGLDTRELAQRMRISQHTVKDHMKSVFEKLGIHSRRELLTGSFD